MTGENRVDPAYKYIDGKVKSLKGEITKLSNRVESLELSGLQEQITLLDSKVKEVDSILLRVERDVATLRILHNELWVEWALRPINTVDSAACIRFARESCSVATTEINTSLNPHKVADAWRTKCADYLHRHGGFETLG